MADDAQGDKSPFDVELLHELLEPARKAARQQLVARVGKKDADLYLKYVDLMAERVWGPRPGNS